MKTIHINRTINRALNVISSAMLNIVSLITSRVLSSKALNAKTVTLLIILTLCSCSTFLSGRARAADVGFTIYNNNAVLELTVPSSVSLELNPTTGTDFSTVNLPIGVGTNNKTGYTLTMTASSDVLARTSSVLDGNGNTISPTIASIDSSINSSDFESSSSTINKWGYKLASSNSYIPIPTSTTTLNTTSGPSNSTNITTGIGDINLNFAAKIDTTTPAGTYRTTLNFIAVTNALPPTINDLEYMQDFANLTTDEKASVLTSMTEGTSYALTDSRDGTEYRVARLADGNVWLLDNLALDPTALTQEQLYGTGANAGKMTNASNTTLGYLKGATVRNPSTYSSGKYATAAVSKAWTSSYSYIRPLIAIDSTTSGVCNNNYCVNSNKSWSYDSVTSVTINGVNSRVQGKIGIYYNYCAASAGSYCYGTSDTAAGTSSGNATEDICPAGWHMPSGDTANGSYYYLYKTGYSSNYNNFVDALSTPLSGYFYSGKAYYQGYNGYFWSSTRYDNYSMYYLRVGSMGVTSQDYGNRSLGNSVRCIVGS